MSFDRTAGSAPFALCCAFTLGSLALPPPVPHIQTFLIWKAWPNDTFSRNPSCFFSSHTVQAPPWAHVYFTLTLCVRHGGGTQTQAKGDPPVFDFCLDCACILVLPLSPFLNYNPPCDLENFLSKMILNPVIDEQRKLQGPSSFQGTWAVEVRTQKKCCRHTSLYTISTLLPESGVSINVYESKVLLMEEPHPLKKCLVKRRINLICLWCKF